MRAPFRRHKPAPIEVIAAVLHRYGIPQSLTVEAWAQVVDQLEIILWATEELAFGLLAPAEEDRIKQLLAIMIERNVTDEEFGVVSGR